MRIFLFVLSALSLLLAAHRFYLAEHTGQHKGGLFFLLIGIQLLVAAALIHSHREERTTKPPAEEEETINEAGESAGNATVEQEKKP